MLSIRKSRIPLLLTVVAMLAGMATKPGGQATSLCPPGFELNAEASRCDAPPSQTYRSVESCAELSAFLAVDHVGQEDRCVRTVDQTALLPRCRDTFELETKPGKDRCTRRDPARSTMPEKAFMGLPKVPATP